jgi:hypothetical protein
VVGRDVSRLVFSGANQNAKMTALDPAQHRVNYFKGNDKANWHCDIPTSLSVRYENIYKNIDLKVYGIEKQVEYDWIVKPGANPADIKVAYKNAKKTYIDKEGNVVIETKFGKMFHKKPVSYQAVEAGGKNYRNSVDVKFKKLAENTYGFNVGAYDKTRELIIDPVVLVYSTYLGGSGADAGYALTVDSAGYVYVTGKTASTDFPTRDEYMLDPTDSDTDVFITRINTLQPGAGGLVYSTYLGGAGADEALGIAVFANNAYVTGFTTSTDFPTMGQYQGNQTGMDAFVTRIDTTQSGAAGLIYSTYLGGSGTDEAGSGIAVVSGLIYVTGHTDSTNFPTSADIFQTDQPGIDVFVTKLDPALGGAGLLFSTYLGGSSADYGTGIKADETSNAYVTGSTDSTNFPAPGIVFYPTPYQAVYGGGASDAFLARIWTAPGTGQGAYTLQYSTYLGGSGGDFGSGLTLDGVLNACVTGSTASADFPTLNQYQTHQGGSDAYVTKINTFIGGVPGLLYSTYLGGSGNDNGFAIILDMYGHAFVTGGTASTDFPVLNGYQTDQTGIDAFVTRLDTLTSGAAGLVFSTYLGGSGADTGFGIGERGGLAFVTGETNSTNFPTVDEYQSDPGDGASDAFVAKLGAASITVISPNGGESWGPGTVENIEWDDTGLTDAVSIALFKDGTPVGYIAAAVEAGGSPYVWTVGEYIGGTAAPGSGYTIKIKELSSTTSDTSDAPFTISSMSLLAPNGFETWPAGSTRDITWNGPGVVNNIKITLWQSAVLVGTIADSVNPALGTYSWTVGQYIAGTAAPGGLYTVKIEEIGTAVSDESDNPFIISTASYITVTSPNGGESWTPDTLQNITWDYGNVSAPLTIALLKNGVPVGLIVDGYEAALGTYSWTVGRFAGGGVTPAGTDYTVKIVEQGASVSDVSDAFFEILPGAFEVISPNGGESLPADYTYNITWDAAGKTGNLVIGLLKDDVVVGVIAKNIDPTLGAYAWTVGQYGGGIVPPDSGYKIGIKLKETGQKDVSDAPFDIVTGPAITVISPNGGENWTIGTQGNIVFAAPGATGLLRIFLFKDGVSIGTIVNNIDPATGSVAWRVGNYTGGTASAGTGYTIKVKQKDVWVADSSDAPFSLSD